MKKHPYPAVKRLMLCFLVVVTVAMSACAKGDTTPTESTQAPYPELTEEWAWTLVENDSYRDYLVYIFVDRVLTEEGRYEWVQDDTYSLDFFGDGNPILSYKSSKINSVEDLQNALSEFYCHSILDTFFRKVSDEGHYGEDGEALAIYKGFWFEAKGTIYFTPEFGKGGMTPIRETMTIETLGDGIYQVSNEFDYSGGDRNYYTVIYEDGGYKIKDITGTYPLNPDM